MSLFLSSVSTTPSNRMCLLLFTLLVSSNSPRQRLMRRKNCTHTRLIFNTALSSSFTNGLLILSINFKVFIVDSFSVPRNTSRRFCRKVKIKSSKPPNDLLKKCSFNLKKVVFFQLFSFLVLLFISFIWFHPIGQTDGQTEVKCNFHRL